MSSVTSANYMLDTTIISALVRDPRGQVYSRMLATLQTQIEAMFWTSRRSLSPTGC